MPLPVQIAEKISAIQQSFTALSPAKDVADAELAADLLQQFEQTLLLFIGRAEVTAEIGQYAQEQLNWLAQQALQLNAEKSLITEQILQITRARKGNASYDDYKSG